jgi:hypothetical protein
MNTHITFVLSIHEAAKQSDEVITQVMYTLRVEMNHFKILLYIGLLKEEIFLPSNDYSHITKMITQKQKKDHPLISLL